MDIEEKGLKKTDFSIVEKDILDARAALFREAKHYRWQWIGIQAGLITIAGLSTIAAGITVLDVDSYFKYATLILTATSASLLAYSNLFKLSNLPIRALQCANAVSVVLENYREQAHSANSDDEFRKLKREIRRKLRENWQKYAQYKYAPPESSRPNEE